MAFSNTVLSVLIVLGLILAVGTLLLLVRQGIRDHEARARGKVPLDRRLELQAESQAKSIQRLENAVRQLAHGERKLGELTQASIRHVGVVRFDAFEDMGGRLSFSAALLDGQGDGVVITSINGRQDARCYAKPVRNWTSVHTLSDEERQAIQQALARGEERRIAEAR
jgi:hypothetical protein